MKTRSNGTRLVVYFVFMAVVLAMPMAIDAQSAGTEQNDKEKRLPMLVRVVPAKKAPIRSFVFSKGEARATKRDFLTFQASGKVTYLKEGPNGGPLKEGDLVQGPGPGEKHGELLAQIDPRDAEQEVRAAEASLKQAEQDMASTKADLDQAIAESELAAVELKRTKTLYSRQVVPQSRLDVAETNYKKAQSAVESARAQLRSGPASVASAEARLRQAEVSLERTKIFVPFDGVLSYLNIRKGDYFAPSAVDTSSEDALLKTIPMVVIDRNQFEITLDLPLHEAALIREGQPVYIFSTQALAGLSAAEISGEQITQATKIRGRVFSVNPAFNPGGRSVQIKVRTDEGADQLVDGLLVICWIVVAEKDDAVVAPFSVFVFRDNRAYVFVVDPKTNLVQEREVVGGLEGLMMQEVTESIKEGELMVTDGRHRLVNGASVEVVEAGGGQKP